MKKTLPHQRHSKKNVTIQKLLLMPLIGFLICFNSCHKDERQNGLIPQSDTQSASLQSIAFRILKAHASSTEFNDIDWTHTSISLLNGKAHVLRLASKSDNTKFLFYSKKNGVSHARWVQFKSNSDSSHSIIVSSISENNRIESVLKNGKILARNVIRSSQQVLSQSISSNSVNRSLATANPGNTSPSTNTTNAGGVKLNTMQPNVVEGGGGGEDDGGYDGGGSGSNDDSMPPGMLAEVTIVAPVTNATVTYYSMYLIMGENPSYTYEYTTSPTGGAGGTTVTITPQTITTRVENQCLNGMVNSVIGANITNQINSLIQSVFGSNVAPTLTIVDVATLPATTDAQTNIIYAGGVLSSATIKLNVNVLPGASKEFIAVTIMHEALHAYLAATTGNSSADHVVLAAKYVNYMTHSLLTMFPSLSPTDAKALAYAGLTGTPTYDADITALGVAQNYAVINSEYRVNTLGHGCSN